MAEHNQRFDSFEEWVNKASSWLTRHVEYTGDKNGVSPFRAICFDAQGRHCRVGADFQRARDENCFPVYWLWPDQVGATVVQGGRTIALDQLLVAEVLGAFKEVLNVSDRDHVAWDRAKAVISKAEDSLALRRR